MAHENDRAAKIEDLLFQPLNGVQVQVVRRFIENQHVVGFGEEASQCDAFQLSSGEVGGVGVDSAQHPEPVECGVDVPPSSECFTHRSVREVRDLIEHSHLDPSASP